MRCSTPCSSDLQAYAQAQDDADRLTALNRIYQISAALETVVVAAGGDGCGRSCGNGCGRGSAWPGRAVG